MIEFLCTVQEECISENIRGELEKSSIDMLELNEISEKNYQ